MTTNDKQDRCKIRGCKATRTAVAPCIDCGGLICIRHAKGWGVAPVCARCREERKQFPICGPEGPDGDSIPVY